MKKIIIALFIVIATTSGCKKQEKIKKKVKEEKIEIIEETPKYKDLNNTPIAFLSYPMIIITNHEKWKKSN